MSAIVSSARMVALQFRFSNPNALPQFVKPLPEEMRAKLIERKNNPGGKLIIESSANTSLEEFLSDLEYSGYEMINAVYFLRSDLKDPTGRHKYHIVRYSFTPREYVTVSDEFKRLRVKAIHDLRGICQSTLWQAEAYSNPFFGQDKLPDPEQNMISVNLTGRRLIEPVWRKDGEGKRVGDAPVLLKPDNVLRFTGEDLQLLPTVV